MKAAPPLAALLLVSLAGCDQPKPRRVAPPAAAPAVAAASVAALPAASRGLAKRPERPNFSLDTINEAQDPLNVPATIRSAGPITFTGFGFDPAAKAPGQAIDIVVDGVAYGTEYGHERQDVAGYYKTEAVRPSGFRTTLPPGTVKPGPHEVQVRVVAADGRSYFDGVAIAFYAR